MINVAYRERTTGESSLRIWTIDLSVTGHANAAEKGKDIVCASMSILCQTLLAKLIRCKNAGFISLEYESKDGSMWLHMKMYTVMTAILEWFDFTMDGIKMLAEEYPQYIKLKEEKEDGSI